MGKQLVLFTTLLLFASGGWSEINIQTVSENIYVFSEIDNQGLIVSGSNGTVVIDPISEHTAKSIQEFLSENDKNAVSHVVYTHSHWDRISGGEVFQKNGVQFISQEACRLFFEGNKNEAVIEPNL
jgi:glyoxylase-like metal-dependent hydrolase (beta-lactamase superfamily II)